ncbi:MAG: hypothetical protein ABSA93_06615 [Streptosporangiaceae bacterium]
METARGETVLTAVGGGDHEVRPTKGSCYQKGKSLPADLLKPWDYPVEAVCAGCGVRITCDNWMADWVHAPREIPADVHGGELGGQPGLGWPGGPARLAPCSGDRPADAPPISRLVTRLPHPGRVTSRSMVPAVT